MADTGLTKVDQKFPIVKEDAEKIKGSIFELVGLPIKLAYSGKDYVFTTYGNEYKKCGGKTYIDAGKAVITTSLVVTSDSLSWLSAYLSQKKEEAKEAAKDKSSN